MGDVYSRQGDLNKAAEEFQKAIEIKPGYADAYHNLANTYQRMGRFDAAIENYQKAAELNPNLWQSHQALAAIYFEQEKYDLALDEIKKALEINPESEGLKQNLQLIISIIFIRRKKAVGSFMLIPIRIVYLEKLCFC